MDKRNAAIETVVRDMPQGRLVGLRRNDVCEFRGIPFARPPIGALRWRLPEPAEPWFGVRDATRFSAVCPQAPSPIDSFLGGAFSVQSEDCLYLNVWMPSLDATNCPVMVWFHGGAFVIGAASQSVYDGTRLATRGVVVVAINYRLGVFGFLDLAGATDGRAPGTGIEGLADQLLALDWVRRNIAAFGGDPANVTIFGESAGAMSIGALLTAPAARGLFHKAILQSGAAHVAHDRDTAARVARAVLDTLSLSPEDADRATEISAGALVRAQTAIIAAAHSGTDLRKLGRLPFRPVIDGSLLPIRPLIALQEGAARGIPLVVGTNREEWKLFSAADPRLRLMSMAGFETDLAKIAGDATPILLKAYSAGSPFERFNALMTDRMFAVPAARLLAAQAPRAPVFGYRFDWRSPFLGGIFGSCHALELGFVFGTHRDGAMSAFFGNGVEAEALAETMMESWVAFARCGNPSAAGTATWPRYDPERRETMILGDGAPCVLHAPEKERIDAWDTVPERRVGP